MAVYDATYRGQVTDAAIVKLDPDKFLGTIGLAADNPNLIRTKTTKPHYLGWPAASSGGWLRVVSVATIGDVDLLPGEQWFCTADDTPAGQPDNWDRRVAYSGASKKTEIAIIRRSFFAKNDPPLTLQPNVLYNINFDPTQDLIVTSKATARDKIYFDISDFVMYSEDLYYDVSAYAEFTPESSGSRQLSIFASELFPPPKLGSMDSRGNLLLGDTAVDSSLEKIAYEEKEALKEGKFTPLPAFREYFYPGYVSARQTVLYAVISHTAVVPIGLKAARLQITVYEVADE